MMRTNRRLPPLLVGLLLGCAGFPGLSQAQILHTQTGEVIPGTEGITPGPGVDLSGWNLPGHTLQYANLTLKDLTNASFVGSDLTHSDFTLANLTNADFTDAVVNGAYFSGASGFTLHQLTSTASYASGELSGIWLTGANLIGINFANKNLAGGNLSFSILSGANFAGANLTNVGLASDLTGAEFAGALIKGANFTEATGFTASQLYSTASYEDGDLSGIWFTRLNLPGINFGNKNLTEADLDYSTLTSANFGGADLRNANLYYANVTGANFTAAVIKGANFFGTTGFTATNLLSTASYVDGDLSDVALPEGIDLTGANFTNKNLKGAHLEGAILIDANFTNANLTNGNLALSNVTNASFTGAVINGARFSEATGFTASQLYSTASYEDGDLSGIILPIGTNLTGASFASKNLTSANLYGSSLNDANFAGANLTKATLSFSFLTGTDFTGADLTGANLSSSNSMGTSFKNVTITDANLARANLTGADFTGVNLTSTNLIFADLTDANFTNAFLGGISFQSNTLIGANFTNANLAEAVFSGRDLTNTSFAGANLTGAILNSAILTNANFEGAVIKEGKFPNVTGFTAAQLFSTASYKSGDLSRLALPTGMDLTSANFSNKNLTEADLRGVTLINSDFSNANLFGAIFGPANLTNVNFAGADLTNVNLSLTNLTGADFRRTDASLPASAETRNTILTSGGIAGLQLLANETLVIRNNLTPVTVLVSASFDPASTLQFLLEENWTSPMRFRVSGPEVALAGTLELEFTPGLNLRDLMGDTFKVFDWSGVTPAGAFTILSPYRWDLSKLYTTGEVTLVPEPATAILAISGLATWATRRRKQAGWQCAVTPPPPLAESASRPPRRNPQVTRRSPIVCGTRPHSGGLVHRSKRICASAPRLLPREASSHELIMEPHQLALLSISPPKSDCGSSNHLEHCSPSEARLFSGIEMISSGPHS